MHVKQACERYRQEIIQADRLRKDEKYNAASIVLKIADDIAYNILSNKEGVEIFLNFLSDEHPAVRLKSASAILRMHPPLSQTAISALQKLEDETGGYYSVTAWMILFMKERDKLPMRLVGE